MKQNRSVGLAASHAGAGGCWQQVWHQQRVRVRGRAQKGAGKRLLV